MSRATMKGQAGESRDGHHAIRHLGMRPTPRGGDDVTATRVHRRGAACQRRVERASAHRIPPGPTKPDNPMCGERLMTTTMQKWEITAPGDANLRLVTAAKPSPKPGEILIAVDAVSLNYRERWIIDGGMGNSWEPPLTLGSDVAGRVVAVGDQVTRFAVGDRVIDNDMVGWLDGDTPPPGSNSFQLGRLAHYVAAPADWFSAAPRSLDAAAASTLPVAGLTAWMALVELGRLRAGQTVVVQGTGGVALFAVQFAAAMGARVILTSSSDEKLERARTYGAT